MARFLPLLAAAAVLLSCGSARPIYTKDRLSPDQLHEMVAEPMRFAEAGDLLRAQGEFETLLARSASGEACDLLTAFGIGLYTLGQEQGEDRFREASLRYLKRAIPATAARFGPDHPEVALALNSYGDAVRGLSPSDPPSEVDEAYARALAIRERTLGPGNPETSSALLSLALVKGLPSRTNGDPARVAEAAALFEEVIRRREANPDQPDYEPAENARFALVEMYVRNGEVAKATAVARTSEAVTGHRDSRCDIGPAKVAVAAALRELGRNAEADATLKAKPPPPAECLFDPTFIRATK